MVMSLLFFLTAKVFRDHHLTTVGAVKITKTDLPNGFARA